MGDDSKDVSAFQEAHEELYGFLLLANQKIANVGTALVWFIGASVFALCVTIHMRWVDHVFWIPIERLRSVLVYLLIAILSFMAYVIVSTLRERAVYYRFKPELLMFLQRDNVSVYSLLSLIDRDRRLKDLAEQIKDDPGFQPRALDKGQ